VWTPLSCSIPSTSALRCSSVLRRLLPRSWREIGHSCPTHLARSRVAPPRGTASMLPGARHELCHPSAFRDALAQEPNGDLRLQVGRFASSAPFESPFAFARTLRHSTRAPANHPIVSVLPAWPARAWHWPGSPLVFVVALARGCPRRLLLFRLGIDHTTVAFRVLAA
jgi:hypothetical protein